MVVYINFEGLDFFHRQDSQEMLGKRGFDGWNIE